MAKRSTVYDVAREAGVSIATVSFSFTKPDRVKPETRQRVLAAAERLRYVPSGNARGLARGRTGALGVYSFDYLLDPTGRRTEPIPDGRLFPLYVDEVQQGVQLEAAARGYALMLDSGRDPSHRPADLAGRVDGLIAFAAAASPDVLHMLSQRMPVVELGHGSNLDGLHTVAVDNADAMHTLADHLLTVHRFRHFAYLSELGLPEFEARYDGFATRLAAAGVTVPPATRCIPGDDESTVAAVRGFIDREEIPEVFVCATDQSALVAVDTLRDAGLPVPDRVAVAGFDGILAARLCRPTLTTVRQPMIEIGRLAVQILADIIDGDAEADRRETLHCTLAVGESCGCPA